MNLDILRVLGLRPPKLPKPRDPNAGPEEALPEPVCVTVQQSAQMLREAEDVIISPGYGMANAGAGEHRNLCARAVGWVLQL